MVNKLWYQVDRKLEDGEDLIIARNYIQKFINFYCFNHEQFKVVEDITTDNLHEFSEIILRNYEQYYFDLGDLSDLGNSLHLYFHRAYFDDFPNTLFPCYPENDRRHLALDVMDYIEHEVIFSEDVPVLIAYLHTADDQLIGADKKLETYFAQFDLMQRNNEEYPRRWKAICEQRIEAIQNNKPLPIKPMGIELDPCYKK